jgi:diguanylate cyclase (GGDEF)-like protein/PAS domain S-box-containing protein
MVSLTSLGESEVPRMALDALPLGVYVADREGKIILWSAGAEQLTGYLRQDVLGRLREAELVENEKLENTAAQVLKTDLPLEPSHHGVLAAAFLSMRCKNGRYLSVQLRSAALRDDAGKFFGTVKVFEPNAPPRLTDHRQDKLGAYGCLDPLTGVLNHSMIMAHVKESLNLYALYPVPFSVMCYGIDDLAKLGERYGRAAVDAALRMVASAFEDGLRPTDFLGRWLELEFLAILPECGENDVMKVGERLRKMVERAGVSWWGDTLHATISIGATIVHDGDTVSSLVSRAEEALRESSRAGGNRVVVLSPDGVKAT